LSASDEPWEGRSLRAASEFAATCKILRDSNPYQRPAIDNIADDLLTELWDRGFSVSEITAAFNRALGDLPRYSAGEDRRGDKSRS
jgi:hypothetical protein